MVQELVLPGSNRRLWIESEEEGKLASMAVVQESDMVHEVYRARLSFISPRGGWGGWLVGRLDGAMAGRAV